MAVVIALLLAALALGVVVYPFFRYRSRDRAGSGVEAPPGREAIYEDMRMLDLEHDLGAVSEKEFQGRMRAYRLRAAADIRDQELRQGELDRALEEEVLAQRAFQGNGPAGRGLCSRCGSPAPSSADLCADCVQEPLTTKSTAESTGNINSGEGTAGEGDEAGS